MSIVTPIKVFAIDIDGTVTENGGGILYLPAISMLRYLERMGYHVIYVTRRSSIEAYILAVFAGTTKIAIGREWWSYHHITSGAHTFSEQEELFARL